MSTDLERTLSAGLRARLDPAAVPTGDLDRVLASGRRIRTGRRVAAAGGLTVAAAAVLGGVLLVGGPAKDGPGGTQVAVDVALGPLDVSQGLRAYADPGQEVHLGGRVFPADAFQALDTDAAATPAGIVAYVAGRPVLLDDTGEVRGLEPGAEATDFTPTAKADSTGPSAAYGAELGGEPTVVVRDLVSDEVLGRRVVPASTVVDAYDDGLVVLRTDEGTSVWDVAQDSVTELGGPRTRVADLRGGVLLFDGPRPDGPATAGLRRLVSGAIDAQLTFDGEHVLSWASRLEPTDPGGRPVVLDEGPPDGGYAFFAIDTDGTVLLAEPGGRSGATVYDCLVPSGACEELGPLSTRGGDPAFIGNDM